MGTTAVATSSTLVDTGTTWHWDAEDRDSAGAAWQRDARFPVTVPKSACIWPKTTAVIGCVCNGDRVRAHWMAAICRASQLATRSIGSQLRWSSRRSAGIK